jgi:hypothetical protein
VRGPALAHQPSLVAPRKHRSYPLELVFGLEVWFKGQSNCPASASLEYHQKKGKELFPKLRKLFTFLDYFKSNCIASSFFLSPPEMKAEQQGLLNEVTWKSHCFHVCAKGSSNRT